MRLNIRTGLLLAACISTLTACGAGDSSSDSLSASAKRTLHSQKTQAQAGDYEEVVQQLYISYFGRPADPAGLASLEQQLLATGVSPDIASVIAAYSTNATVKSLVDAFGTSTESARLYGNGSTADFVTAVFNHILSRAPATSGLTYWTGQIDGNFVSKANAALTIMDGALVNTTAQGLLDAQLIDNRVTVAEQFTVSVSSENAVGSYRGSPAANIARNMLSGVIATTDTGNVQTSIDAAIASMPTPLSFSFSPYKEISSGGADSNAVMLSSVTGTSVTQTAAMPSANSTVTWAFAQGVCGSESWDGVDGATFAGANVAAFVNAGKYYTVSTGGYGQQFKCTTDAGFSTFLQRYYSSSMLGVDFDIEGGSTPDWTQSDVNNLVQRVATAQQTYPNLRFSFTVGTTGGSAVGLGSYGSMVLQAIKTYGLKNYLINLMAMDYGPGATSDICVVSNSLCEMGQSAVLAATSLHSTYGIPYNQIELTPMIGQNDSTPDIFQVGDIVTVSAFVKSNGLAGVHFWSFDRDADCAFNTNGPSASCNGVGNAGALGFTNGFIKQLGL